MVTMKPRVEVYVGPRHDLVHTSLVMTGLCALADRGAIALEVSEPRQPSDRWLIGDPIVLVLDVHGSMPTRLAIDLRDGEGWSSPILERVDHYFKRAYSTSEAERLRTRTSARLAPFGLNYPCRSRASAMRVMRSIGFSLARLGRDGLARTRSYLRVPPPAAFEQSPSVAVEPRVSFQTRVWAPEDAPPGEAELVNAERVAMVRALKKEFGPAFVGGLMPTPYARDHYPDDLTPHSSKNTDYLRLTRQCLIGVYTRGLEHSLAFKLGETLAASQCLVSVPLRYELPVPLERDRHFVEFNGIDGCLEACHRLLADRAWAQEMRDNNHAYYLDQVEPAAHLADVLQRVGVSAPAA